MEKKNHKACFNKVLKEYAISIISSKFPVFYFSQKGSILNTKLFNSSKSCLAQSTQNKKHYY